MSEKIRKRTIIDKVDRNGELNLDEQEMFIQYMREDIHKQKTFWRTSFTVLVSIIICGIMYGFIEGEHGVLSNIVGTLTIGPLSNALIFPVLSLCIVECLLSILYLFFPWIRHLMLLTLLIPVLFVIVVVIVQVYQHSKKLGIPCLPLVVMIIPICTYIVEKDNRHLWKDLDELEETRSKYKSV